MGDNLNKNNGSYELQTPQFSEEVELEIMYDNQQSISNVVDGENYHESKSHKEGDKDVISSAQQNHSNDGYSGNTKKGPKLFRKIRDNRSKDKRTKNGMTEDKHENFGMSRNEHGITKKNNSSGLMHDIYHNETSQNRKQDESTNRRISFENKEINTMNNNLFVGPQNDNTFSRDETCKKNSKEYTTYNVEKSNVDGSRVISSSHFINERHNIDANLFKTVESDDQDRGRNLHSGDIQGKNKGDPENSKAISNKFFLSVSMISRSYSSVPQLNMMSSNGPISSETGQGKTISLDDKVIKDGRTNCDPGIVNCTDESGCLGEYFLKKVSSWTSELSGSESKTEERTEAIPLSLSRTMSWVPPNFMADVEEDDEPSEFTLHINDFNRSTWEQVTQDSEKLSAVGLAAVMAATIIIHPLVFVTGAATAMWAVGVFHAYEKGYEFFSDNSFSSLFWKDDESNVASLEGSLQSKEDMIRIQEQRVIEAKKYADKIDSDELDDSYIIGNNVHDKISSQSSKKNENESNNVTEQMSIKPLLTDNLQPVTPCIPSCSHDSTSNNISTQIQKEITSTNSIIQQHFPPLEDLVIEKECFHGLNAIEFFQVFFSDTAPYSLEQFQEQRGDIDIDTGLWVRCSDTDPLSFHPDVHNPSVAKDLPPFPKSSKKIRKIEFKTLTKSYFGPAYATAKKTMKVTKVSNRLIIMENRTDLFDIPFHDRFFVLERWIIESFKNLSINGQKIENGTRRKFSPSKNKNKTTELPPTPYTSKLTVSVQVFMLKSSSWEKQIRSKTITTIKDFVSSWCQKAKKALELTVKNKLERMRESNVGDTAVLEASFSEDHNITCSKCATSLAEDGDKSKQDIMKIHQKNLKELEKKISIKDTVAGDNLNHAKNSKSEDISSSHSSIDVNILREGDHEINGNKENKRENFRNKSDDSKKKTGVFGKLKKKKQK